MIALPQDCTDVRDRENDLEARGLHRHQVQRPPRRLENRPKDVHWVSLSGDKPAVCTIARVPPGMLKLIHALGRAKPAIPLPSRA